MCEHRRGALTEAALRAHGDRCDRAQPRWRLPGQVVEGVAGQKRLVRQALMRADSSTSRGMDPQGRIEDQRLRGLWACSS